MPSIAPTHNASAAAVSATWLRLRRKALRDYACLVACALAIPAGAQPNAASTAFDLSIEDLGQIRVTTASRRAEALDVTPAAAYVITSEEIRRSGVTTIQDALRLAPGVEVARNGSHSWTISIRGFSNNLSNKLLVLIDGRSVYSPLYAGVFWDVQDVLLADVERIEVVAGPGGAVWGANAVNGVINIITKNVQDRQGLLAEIGGGNQEQGFAAVRYGWKINDKLSASAFVKTFDRDTETLAATGGSANDDWRLSHGGFALLWEPDAASRLTVRTDIYDGRESILGRGDFTLGTLPATNVPATVPLSGGNVIANWTHTLADDASWRLQFWFDHTDRQIPGSFNEARSTYNLAFLHDLRQRKRHDVQWGVELRSTSDDIGNTTFSSFMPPQRTDRTLSTFAQDRIELKDERLYLTLGTKLEHNDYTGFESEPSMRLTFTPEGGQRTYWAALSRAVRVPARLNTDVHLYAPVVVPGLPPVYINVNGTPDFESETVDAYELGYRMRASDKLSFDVTAFDNFYDHLQTNEPAGGAIAVPGPPAYLVIPAVEGNLMQGKNYGATFSLTWQPLTRWRLKFNASRFEMELATKPGGADTNSLRISGNSPENMLSVLSFLELKHDVTLYTGVRHVDELPSLRVPAYNAVDASVAWRPTERLRLSLTAQNLNDTKHLEFSDGVLIERSVFVRFDWRL
jgi:iron complex outermembrane recepter protein